MIFLFIIFLFSDYNYDIVDEILLERGGLQVALQCSVTSSSVFENVIPIQPDAVVASSVRYEIVGCLHFIFLFIKFLTL